MCNPITGAKCASCKSSADLAELEAEVRAEAARLGKTLPGSACKTLAELKAQALAFGMTDTAAAIDMAGCSTAPADRMALASGGPYGGPVALAALAAAGKAQTPEDWAAAMSHVPLPRVATPSEVSALLRAGQGHRVTVRDATGKSMTLVGTYENGRGLARLKAEASFKSEAAKLNRPRPPKDAAYYRRQKAMAEAHAELDAERQAEAERQQRDETWTARHLQLAQAQRHQAQQDDEGYVDARMRPVRGPKGKAAEAEARQRELDEAERKRAERKREMDRLDRIVASHRRRPSILGQPPEVTP
jgi:hypothetical protein